MSKPSDPRVIVALDYASKEEALNFVRQVTPDQCRLKVGLELYTAAGPLLIAELTERGFAVFLDLKFHDIPHTVARACRRAAELGVWMLNVHALGGRAMLTAAREAIDAASHRPALIAVTMLTSHGPGEVQELGLERDLERNVLRLARLSQDTGLDGVVCSGQEAARLRTELGRGFLLVTPGIRRPGTPPDDQARTLAPREALAVGASYLVIGRPITQAAEPFAALAEVNAEIAAP